MKPFLSSLFLLTCSLLNAQDPLWMRYPAISPDGTQIVFSYKGDLYLVASGGGKATALTIDDGYESMPVWSPDGNTIAFVSDQYGNLDIFTVPASGGPSERLTYHSGDDIPYAFTPDNTHIVFSARRMDKHTYAQYPYGRMPEVYRIPVSGGRPRMVVTTSAEEITFNKSGDVFYYQDKKGYEDPWRKHHQSSITRDIWSYNLNSNEYTQLTDFVGEDREPVLSSNGKVLYYLSEESGTFNVHQMNLADQTTEQVTTFENHPVRSLSISEGGQLCYSWDGAIYTQQEGQQPKKIAVEIVSVRQMQDRQIVPVSGEVTEMALSPNGKELAFIVRGEIYATSVDKGGTKRITNTPTQERSVSFSPDGTAILYAGERNGSWNVYQTKLTRPEEKYFYNSTVLEESDVIATDATEFQPSFSPDGKEVAYLQERTELRVINLASGQTRTIVPWDKNYSYSDGDQWYEWSPDGAWFLVNFLPDNHWIDEVGLVSAKGGELTNLTWSGYADRRPRWMDDGKMMIWFSDRDGMKNHASWGSEDDVYGMFFTQEAFDRYQLSEADYALIKEEEKDAENEDKEKEDEEVRPEVKIDLKGIENRKVKLSIHSSRLSDAVVTPDAAKLIYLARFEKGYDLWTTDLRSKETKTLAKLNAERAGSLVIDKKSENIFLMADGSIQKVNIESGEKKSIAVKGEMEWKKSEELAYIFDHSWKQVLKKFYVKDLHGVDWNFYYDEYKKFLPHITNNRDFTEMLSELLGELNASHTGARYRPQSSTSDNTASLGLFLDDTPANGLRVTEVLEDGPLDVAGSKVRSGSLLTRIDWTDITEDLNYFQLLNRKEGEKVLLTFSDGKNTWEEVVIPISSGAENNLLYERWVKNRRKEVEEASGGKIGYVHVRSMNDNSYRTVFEEVLGRNANKESLIVDTRFNGGGWLHEDLATFLNGDRYIEMVPRGQMIGFEPQRKWTKPTVLLIGEGNYSDAHMFPYAYNTKNMGTMVGMPIPGTGTAVWWESQIDPTIVFGIPQVGMLDVNGKYLENQQLEPDVKVKNNFNHLTSGTDDQLQKAVEILISDQTRKPSDTSLDTIEKKD